MKLKVSSSELHDLYLLEKPQDYFFPTGVPLMMNSATKVCIR